MEEVSCSARHRSAYHNVKPVHKGVGSMAIPQLPSFGDEPVYNESTHSPDDVLYSGSEDGYYDSPSSRTRCYEDHARQFLQGRPPALLSASLRGPFEKESGWTNPWTGKRGRIVRAGPEISKHRKSHTSVADAATPASVMKDKLQQRVLSWREDVQPSLFAGDELFALPSTGQTNDGLQSKKRAAGSDWLRRRNLKRMRSGDDVVTVSPTTIHSKKSHRTARLKRSVSVPAHNGEGNESVGDTSGKNIVATFSKRKRCQPDRIDDSRKASPFSHTWGSKRAASVPSDLQFSSPTGPSYTITQHESASNSDRVCRDTVHLESQQKKNVGGHESVRGGLTDIHTVENSIVSYEDLPHPLPADKETTSRESSVARQPPQTAANEIGNATPLGQEDTYSELDGTTFLPSGHMESAEGYAYDASANHAELASLPEDESVDRQIASQLSSEISLPKETNEAEDPVGSVAPTELSEPPNDGEIDAFEGAVGGSDVSESADADTDHDAMVQDETNDGVPGTADDSRVATQDQSPWVKAQAVDAFSRTRLIGHDANIPPSRKQASVDDKVEVSTKYDSLHLMDNDGPSLSQNPWMEGMGGFQTSSSASLPQQLTSPCSPNTHVWIPEVPNGQEELDVCLPPIQTPRVLPSVGNAPPSTPETKQSSLPTPDQTISIKSFRRFRSPTPTPPPRPRVNNPNGLRSALVRSKKRPATSEPSSRSGRSVRFSLPGEDNGDCQSDRGENNGQSTARIDDEDDYIEAGLSSRSINRLSVFCAKGRNCLPPEKQHARAASPPPQESVSAEDLPSEVEKFKGHFAMVANRATEQETSHKINVAKTGVQIQAGLFKTARRPLFESPKSPPVDAMASRFKEIDAESTKIQLRPSLRPVAEQSSHETKSQDSIASGDKENFMEQKLGSVMESHREEEGPVDDVQEVMDNLDDFLRMWDVDSDLAKVQSGGI